MALTRDQLLVLQGSQRLHRSMPCACVRATESPAGRDRGAARGQPGHVPEHRHRDDRRRRPVHVLSRRAWVSPSPVLLAKLSRPCPGPSFVEVEFGHRSGDESSEGPAHSPGLVYLADGEGGLTQLTGGSVREGDFRDPKWRPVEDVGQLVGCPVEEWLVGKYTARNLFGDHGSRVCEAVARHAHEAAVSFIARLQLDQGAGEG